ncbi:MAG: transporter, family, multidrug resistance protein, partial [Actinomycetota bacterium]|nr:transporter, family, multidrug resistance protein [Actinomycetota bacterium]
MTATALRPTSTNRLWDRELDHYPKTSVRFTSLGIVVVATIILYYQFYLAGAVAAHIIADYHMSFVYYVNISVAGYLLGAVASFVTGIADRYGRANIVTVGLFITGMLCLVGIPNAHSKLGFGILFAAIGMVEGVILVATPALIRDFSPQLGRASAMGFWTLGPVMGSLVVSVIVSNTSDSTPWQDQYVVCGVVGLVVAVVALFGLRELAPGLRDQLMVSSRDRALIEARAKGIDVEASLRHPFRQMLKPDIVTSAFAISVFLIIYYTAVGFFPIYFQTVFGFSQSKANALGNWNWTFNAIALLAVGFLSDRIRVRKPFMVIGALGAIVFTLLFMSRATHPHTSYSTFVWLLVGLSLSLGVAYAPWMASFTETVERRNPALTATGLAVWGLIIRIVIAVSVFIVPHIVDTVTTLVDKGTTVQAAAAGA